MQNFPRDFEPNPMPSVISYPAGTHSPAPRGFDFGPPHNYSEPPASQENAAGGELVSTGTSSGVTNGSLLSLPSPEQRLAFWWAFP